MRAAAIVNPHAGGGSARRRWPAVARALEARLGAVEVRFTEAPGHAEALAAELARAGFDPVIAAGGDGTLNEVANGLLASACDVRLGLIPLASGGDFARTLGVTRWADAIEVVARGRALPTDAVRVRYRIPQGERERSFVNVASIGLGALAAARPGRWAALLPARLRYLAAAVGPLARGRSFAVRLSRDGGAPEAFRVTLLALANARYQGGGIHIAPTAAVDDGRIDITLVETVSLAEVVAHLPLLYNGRILTYPKVRHRRVAALAVDGDAETPVELDGELVGTLPLEARVLPGALRVMR